MESAQCILTRRNGSRLLAGGHFRREVEEVVTLGAIRGQYEVARLPNVVPIEFPKLTCNRSALMRMPNRAHTTSVTFPSKGSQVDGA
jgi:hypothetical protein